MQIMVELYRGYGDGYGIVESADGASPDVLPGREVTRYTDCGVPTPVPMEEWKRRVLAAPSVELLEGVRVEVGAVKRVIGPVDCPEACRVRMRRFTKNWGGSRRFIDAATDEEVSAAMSSGEYDATAAACRALRSKYAAA